MGPARIHWGLLPLVVAGGVAGVSAREALTLLAGGWDSPAAVPAATLAINVAGACLLGIVVGGLGARHPRWRAFLGTGALGGFTTYSAFAVQTADALRSAPVAGAALAVVTIAGGMAAAALGHMLGRRIGRQGHGGRESPREAE